MRYFWLDSQFLGPILKKKRINHNIDFIKFIYVHARNVHFGYDVVMGTYWFAVAKIKSTTKISHHYLRFVFIYLPKWKEKVFFFFLDLALCGFYRNTKIVLYGKPASTSKKLFIEANGKNSENTYDWQTQNQNPIAMCYHIDLMKFYYLCPLSESQCSRSRSQLHNVQITAFVFFLVSCASLVSSVVVVIIRY